MKFPIGFQLSSLPSRLLVASVLKILVLGAVTWPVRAGEDRASTRPLPEPVAPLVDSRIIESREKVTEKRWQTKNAKIKGKKDLDRSDLQEMARKGDLRAALKAKDQRRGRGEKETPQQQGEIERLVDKGMADGVPEAFLAKAEIEWERGESEKALAQIRNASKRGSHEADFRLAKLKAGKPQWASVPESSITLLHRAAAKGSSSAALELGLTFARGEWRTETANPIRGDKDQERAVAWMERAYMSGNSESALWLGLHYMRTAEGLVDIRRQKALQYLLSARKAGTGLREPDSGKTFAELEAAGAIEPGLLGEIKRREAAEQKTRQSAAAPAKFQKAGPPDRAPVRRVDHAVVDIVGPARGEAATYNLVGLSPYKEVAAEGSVSATTGDWLTVDTVPNLGAIEGWFVEIVVDGRQIMWTPLLEVDAVAKLLRIAVALPDNLSGAVRFRLVRHHTLYSTFGRDNAVGLKPATQPSAADEIIVYNPLTQERRQFFYHSDLLQWAESNTGTKLEDDVNFAPGWAILVKRTEPAPLSLQVRGMLPPQVFNPATLPGISFISLRKNVLGTAVAALLDEPATTAAKDVPVLVPRERGKAWKVDRKSGGSSWWSLLGLQPTTRISLSGSAAVVVNQ